MLMEWSEPIRSTESEVQFSDFANQKKGKNEDVEGKGPSVRLHYRGFGLPVVGVAISARELFLPSNRQ